MTAVTYIMMIALPRNFQHKVVMGFVLAYLSGSHIYRMVTNYGGWDMDITTYTMILTAKLSALSFCYKDGGEKEETLLPEQKERKVVELPSVLELLSYVFFCSGCIVGPFFEFSDYKMYIEEKGRYSNIPLTFVPAMIKFFKGKSKFHGIFKK
jgi:MBOAT, membrane-bound O-acyltransferase family